MLDCHLLQRTFLAERRAKLLGLNLTAALLKEIAQLCGHVEPKVVDPAVRRHRAISPKSRKINRSRQT